jgi:hypothetical protein
MLQPTLQLDGGWCPGPLFGPVAKRAAPKDRETRHLRRRSIERRQTPGWVDQCRIRELFAEARRLSMLTGIRHSVEHIVPLAGGTVCGLHWHGNMEVLPLRENLVKGTRWWPQMWGEQAPLLRDQGDEAA